MDDTHLFINLAIICNHVKLSRIIRRLIIRPNTIKGRIPNAVPIPIILRELVHRASSIRSSSTSLPNLRARQSGGRCIGRNGLSGDERIRQTTTVAVVDNVGVGASGRQHVGLMRFGRGCSSRYGRSCCCCSFGSDIGTGSSSSIRLADIRAAYTRYGRTPRRGWSGVRSGRSRLMISSIITRGSFGWRREGERGDWDGITVNIMNIAWWCGFSVTVSCAIRGVTMGDMGGHDGRGWRGPVGENGMRRRWSDSWGRRRWFLRGRRCRGPKCRRL